MDDTGIRNGRWRVVGAVAILVATALAVMAFQRTGDARPAASAAQAGNGQTNDVDEAFLRLTIAMDNSALGLFVLLQNDSSTLAGVGAQLAESHRAELNDLRLVLQQASFTETRDGYEGTPGVITGDDLVAVHQAPAASRDALAMDLINRHLAEGASMARTAARSGRMPAVKELATRIQQSRTSQITMLAILPTVAPSKPAAPG